MSDLLSPILFVIRDEAEAFWCCEMRGSPVQVAAQKRINTFWRSLVCFFFEDLLQATDLALGWEADTVVPATTH